LSSWVLQLSGKAYGARNVPRLRRLVAASKQDDERRPTPRVVEPVSGPNMDVCLHDTRSDRLRVTKVTLLHALHRHENLGLRLAVGEPPQLTGEL
jgi:hypothetical protein